MATVKPSKPNINLPDNFGGAKTPYSDDQVTNGYQVGVPTTVDGGNINYEKDGLFQYIKYLKTVADVLVDMSVGKTVVIDDNNRFDYVSPENNENKTQALNQYSTEKQYPSAKAVYDAIKGFAPDLFAKLAGNNVFTGQNTFNQNILTHSNIGVNMDRVMSGSPNIGWQSLNGGVGRVYSAAYYLNGVLIHRMFLENYTSGKSFYMDMTQKDDGSVSVGFSGTTYELSTNANSYEVPTAKWVKQVAALKDLSNAITAGVDSGYVYIGDLLIQWGIEEGTIDGQHSRKAEVIFDKPYAEVPAVICNPMATILDSLGYSTTSEASETGATFYIISTGGNLQIYGKIGWIAIGKKGA